MIEILKSHYVDGIYHTHTSMIRPIGKFQFNRNDLEIFWELYCDKISNEENPIVGITEKSQQYMPVLVDIDIKLKEEQESKSEHLYTEENVLSIISIYQSVLRNIIDEISEKDLMCVLLEKPIYYIEKGQTIFKKNGFHLHFPNIFLNKNDIQTHLYPRVIDIVKAEEPFSNIVDDSSSLIDNCITRNNWLLYGSRKEEDMEPYKISKFFDSQCKEITIEEAFRDYKIFDNNERRINIRNRIQYYLPRILSIIPYGRDNMELKSNLPLPLKQKIKQERITKIENNKNEVSTENLKIASKLLPMISTFRSKEYSEWINIGFALYNISQGSNEGLDIWLEFSERAEECYDEESCISQWEKMTIRENGLSLGTIRYLAMKDSPEEYKKFKNEKSEEYLKDSLNGSHNDIARALYEEFGDMFVCSCIQNKTWYQFREHRWEEIESGVFLREKISSFIYRRFTNMGKQIYDKMSDEKTDDVEEEYLKIKLKNIQKMQGNCKSSPFKNNVMNEAMEVFYDDKFSKKLNQNPYLIGFKNGVYDLQLNIFRDGIPDDCISKSLPIKYKKYDMGDSQVQLVIDFLTKVFPDDSIRTYFLDMYSDIFVGGNTQKVVLFWTGEGDNGKSITQNLLEEMLGELAIKFDTTLFSGKKTGLGNASPELARAQPPVRLATMEEPDRNEELNIGYLKKLSGGDKYWARDLFEKGKATREVKPMFMLTFICNALPKLKHSDQATWNRIRVIPFESTFVKKGESCPETLEEQIREKRFPRDSEFSTKIPTMLEAFAWYLLEWRKNISIRIEPSKVREATEIYRKQNDMYRQYIEECLIEDDLSKISLTELYLHFKDWFREGFPNMSLPVKNDVKEHFDKLYDFRSFNYQGIRLKTLRDTTEYNKSKVEEFEIVNE